ncbi:M15 family metallopeptidase [Arcobacter sp. LA11]|uniref:M15 family metallopeptidase n=1 Tax=Arcobacter sp. LA11 TaxID=1898176 RepID=UPI000934C4AC|nr:M15 family metallopeptidase [Arcobacter sp. LA11]
MKRRDFFKYSTATVILPTITTTLNATNTFVEQPVFPTRILKTKLLNIPKEKIVEEKVEVEITKPEIKKIEPEPKTKIVKKDKFLEEKYINDFISVREKLKFVQSHVGYGNFNVLSFDEMLRIAKYSSKTSAFSKSELNFLESIFYYDPSYHGFYGERISKNITDRINKKDINKIPRTGHYLFKGEPEKIYQKMKDDVGESLTLTSGVRSIVKQTKLFLDKLDSVDGNLSIASKSLAPPAFTYHSIADFDVGKKGFGYANFTPRFALTEEFLKMRKLKYIDMRYTINNKDGVRYEPWHVKII